MFRFVHFHYFRLLGAQQRLSRSTGPKYGPGALKVGVFPGFQTILRRSRPFPAKLNNFRIDRPRGKGVPFAIAKWDPGNGVGSFREHPGTYPGWDPGSIPDATRAPSRAPKTFSDKLLQTLQNSSKSSPFTTLMLNLTFPCIVVLFQPFLSQSSNPQHCPCKEKR